MDLEHTFSVPIGIDAAWVAFNDLEGIAPCFPGAVITSVDGDDFTGTAKVKLGPVALQYSGKGQWLSRDQSAFRAVIEAVGKDKRGNGTASATITAHLESDGPTQTTVVVNTDLRITGRPAQFGRGVIQDVGSKILDQFAACLSERLGQDDGPVTVVGDGEEPVVESASAVEAQPQAEPQPPREPQPQPEAVLASAPAAEQIPGVAPVSGSGVTAGDAAEDIPDVGATEADADPTSGSDAPPTAAPATPMRMTDVPTTGAPLTGAAMTGSPRPSIAKKADALPAEPMELDLGGLVGPVLLKRYGPTAAACLVTAVITWVVARRLP